ncbi:MAG: glycosyltransferase [Flavobacterium sp.]|uniref:glycosyltransferase n=1 Tax=Flavobacterium sp. TaxID=239 RepID=UPI0025BBFA2B|nr:glycosyltransferase [Flavobacterium sp.]MCK6607367.1 glycosyltransferase [Flavobacterium sp.]
MKILMVSIPTLHFFRWANQLQDAGHEVYWFDITGMSQPVSKISWIQQKVDWKLRWDYPGRLLVKNKFPKLYKFIQQFNEKDTAKTFENYLNEIQPDVVHSFALYLSCSPIIEVMEKNPTQKWIYSSWGSDLFYFQNEPNYLKDIKRVLPRINYLFTDCKRDYEIAKQYGFTGEFLGVFPGGGGFELNEMETYKLPVSQRKTILIKGFQGRSGRAIPVLKAIATLKEQLLNYEIVVFGSDPQTFEYVTNSELKNWKNFQILGKIPHEEVLKLMGKSLIYIGNSNSDGMPNTMLEAIFMGAFPIQSNPGGATAELIQNGVNGLLIEDCEDEEKIKEIVIHAVNNCNFEKAECLNQEEIVPKLHYLKVKNEVISIYKKIN